MSSALAPLRHTSLKLLMNSLPISCRHRRNCLAILSKADLAGFGGVFVCAAVRLARFNVEMSKTNCSHDFRPAHPGGGRDSQYGHFISISQRIPQKKPFSYRGRWTIIHFMAFITITLAF
jgi:hypothetical protein